MSLPEEIVASGKLFELVHETQPDGRVFEKARRAPGVRLILVDQPKEKVLLTKEFRKELEGWDYRLPGGKVFDSLGDYDAHRQSGTAILEAAAKKAREEAVEEAGIAVKELDLFRKSTLGATVEWDLYVFEASKWSLSEGGQQLEEGEMIEAIDWFGYEEIEAMIMRGDMQEDRIALILLQWIAKQKESTK